MNPNSGQTPLDYLNQIAPKAPKRQGFALNIRTVLIIGAGLMLVVLILAGIVNAAGSSKQTAWTKLSARLTTTQAIAESSTATLKSSQLRSLNSDLKLYLSNTQRDLGPILVTNKVNAEKIPQKIIDAEDGAEITTRLEDGRLNAKFDSTYAREMGYQLATILALYQELYGSSSDQASKTFLNSAYDNLLPTQKALDSFNATSE